MDILDAILFFDLDNTLVRIENSHKFFDDIIVEVFNQYHIPVPNKEQRDQLWRNSNYKQLLCSWNFPDPVAFWKSFDNIDLKYRKELFQEGKLQVFDDVVPTLKKLSKFDKVRVVLITNSSYEITEFELDIFRLKSFFHNVIALGDTQDDCKPNPSRILQELEKISTEFRFSYNRVYIIGDGPDDISAAKNASVKSILIKRRDKSHRHWSDQPDYIITQMKQLFSILQLA